MYPDVEGGPLVYMALCIPLGLARRTEWSYGSDNLLVLPYNYKRFAFSKFTAVGSHTRITLFGPSLFLLFSKYLTLICSWLTDTDIN